MKLSDIAIKNPVFSWMLMSALIIFGAIGFIKIGKGMLPDVDFPIISVSVRWEGASPEVMETDVVDVIEDAMTSVKGLKKINSTSRLGQAQIIAEFDLKTNVDVALQTRPSSQNLTLKISRLCGSRFPAIVLYDFLWNTPGTN